MQRHPRIVLLVPFALLCLQLSSSPAAPAQPPAGVRDQNTLREFPEITTLAQWKERASEIRQQILVSSGLWPMPQKTPLHPVIFGKIIRDGYSFEKVYFQTYPGFYLAGNLYRPVGKGNGPFPAVINPHGHWENGRLVDARDCSIPGRCINFARQGMIAFSYDMVGYNDTHFPESPTNVPFYKIHRDFATNDPANLLWNISLMGLQTWNSIRALDLVESLPDADPHRLACTGASGGGTQTFILGAVDDRLSAQAPVVMVSHSMQGGCGCENMPGLRVEFSNMEIAAAVAPRPQIMVGASGDWTKTMMTLEGPAVAHIYDLFKSPENLRYVRFDFPHNYNQTSREVVYQWFDKCLLAQPDTPVKEVAFQKEPDHDLRVFPDGKLPPDALSQQDFIKSLVAMHKAELQSLQPTDENTLLSYKQMMEPAWKRTLNLGYPDGEIHSQITLKSVPTNADYTLEEHRITRRGDTNGLGVLCFQRGQSFGLLSDSIFVLLADAKGSAAFCDDSGRPTGLARRLLDKHFNVGVVEGFPRIGSADQTSIMFSTYNRTWFQSQVYNLANACHSFGSRVVLCGTGRAGIWCLLAAPASAAVIADCDQLDISQGRTLLAPDLFCPGIRNVDTFAGALILAAPHPLLLHDLARTFPTRGVRSAYKVLGKPNKFRSESHRLTDDEIVSWISALK